MIKESIIAEYLPEKEATDALADYFALFADRTRMRIVSLLSIGELCVNDVATLLRMSQSTVSHQLQILKESHVVNCRRDGKRNVYFLSDRNVEEMCLMAVIATEN